MIKLLKFVTLTEEEHKFYESQLATTARTKGEPVRGRPLQIAGSEDSDDEVLQPCTSKEIPVQIRKRGRPREVVDSDDKVLQPCTSK